MAPLFKISMELTPGDRRSFQFRRTFRIGRMEDCEVFVDNDFVSRYHAEIVFESGRWWVRDLGSSNGIYIGAQRVESVPIEHATTIRLGIYGPEVSLEVEQPSTPESLPAGSPTVLARYVDHYFGKTARTNPSASTPCTFGRPLPTFRPNRNASTTRSSRRWSWP